RSSRHPSKKTESPLNISLIGIRVLVVEDETETRQMLTTLLTTSKAEVRSVASVEQALAEMQRWTPHVLLSDIGMPGATGYDLIRSVRSAARKDLGKIPAIALTAYAKKEDRQRAISEGFNTHVTKPIEPAELINLIYNLSQCGSSNQKFVN